MKTHVLVTLHVDIEHENEASLEPALTYLKGEQMQRFLKNALFTTNAERLPDGTFIVWEIRGGTLSQLLVQNRGDKS